MNLNTNPNSAGCRVLLYLLLVIIVLSSASNTVAKDLDLRVVGQWSPGSGQGVGLLSVDEGFAFCQLTKHGQPEELVVVDVHVPTAPHTLGSYVLPSGRGVHALASSGRVAYMATSSYGDEGTQQLEVIDIHDPTAPHAVGILEMATSGGRWPKVAVHNNYVYVSTDDSGFDVVDVSEPSTPQRVGHYDVSGYLVGLAFLDHRGYVVCLGDYDETQKRRIGSSIKVIDLTDPRILQEVGSVAIDGHPMAVATSDGYVYLAALGPAALSGGEEYQDQGLLVYDVSDPANPTKAGAWEGSFDSVALCSGLACITTISECGPEHLEVLDLSDATKPRRVGHITGVHSPALVSDHYAYLTEGRTLQVIDLDRAAQPQRIFSSSPIAPMPWYGGFQVAASGNLAFLSEGPMEGSEYRRGLRIFDVTGASNPRAVGLYTDMYPRHVYQTGVNGNHVFIAGRWVENGASKEGLRIIGLGIPNNPQEIGDYESGILADDVIVFGDVAYLISWHGLEVVDISEPSQPRRIGGDEELSGNRMILVGPYLYAAGGSGWGTPWSSAYGLRVIDVSDPANPQLVGRHEIVGRPGMGSGGEATGLALSGEHLYVFWLPFYCCCDTGTGFVEVLDISDAANPQLLSRYESPEFQGRGGASMAILGDYAYLGFGGYRGEGVKVLDIRDPANLRQVGSNSAFSAGDLAIHGGHIYVAAGADGLAVLNPVAAIRHVPTEGGAAIEWDHGMLQSAPTVNGPWTDLPAASPMPLLPLGEKGFFRVNQGKADLQPIDNMVWIPPGTFTMGSSEDEQGLAEWMEEGPPMEVTLKQGFWMGKYEVTQGEYEALMGDNPSRFKDGPDFPVEAGESNAVDYCRALTDRERVAGRVPAGYEYRLPTEAQWEYACRAGTTERFSFGNALQCEEGACAFCSELDQYMWWCGNSGRTTHPVGQKEPNPWGLYDMHGNVSEWCAGAYMHPDEGPVGVARGGSGNSASEGCRSASRFPGYWGGDGPYWGFRVVLVQVP